MTDFAGHRPIPFWVWWRGWLLQGREGFLLSRRSDELLIHAHGQLWGWHSLLTGMHWPKSQPYNTVWQCLREKGTNPVRWLWVSLGIVLGFILGRKGRVRSWMEQLPKNKWNQRKKYWAMLPWVLQSTQIYIEQNTLQNIMLHEKLLNVVQPGGARCKEKSACSKNRLFPAYTVQTAMLWCTVEKVVKVAILAFGGWNCCHKQQTVLNLQLVYEIKGWDTSQLSSGRPLYKTVKNMVLISASKYFSEYL